MNRTELYEKLDGKISKTAIRPTGDEPSDFKIVGKFGEIEPMEDGIFDVWLTNMSCPAATLGTGKLNNMLRAAGGLVKAIDLILADGEAWFEVKTAEEVVALAPVLSFRKTRKMSPEQLETARASMSRASMARMPRARATQSQKIATA